MSGVRLHHVAQWVTEDQVDACMDFYTAGIGLEVVVDFSVPSPWHEIFEVPYNRLRTIMLGQPDDLWAGYLELVVFDDALEGAALPEVSDKVHETTGPPRHLLCSFFVDLDPTLTRLRKRGYGEDWRELTTLTPGGPGRVGTLRDPAGFMVELADNPLGMALMEAGLQARKL